MNTFFQQQNHFTIIIFLCLSSSLGADNYLILKLKHAPEQERKAAEQAYQKEMDLTKSDSFENQTPGDISLTMSRAALEAYLTPPLSGVPAIYGGYFDISNPSGLITFPLRHASPQVYIAITPSVELVAIKENTFDHLEFIQTPKNPTELYLFEKKDEKETEAEDVDNESKQEPFMPFWRVSHVKIPANKEINPLTIVLLAKPKYFIVQEGDYPAPKSPHMVLPDAIFVLNDRKTTAKTLLNLLDIKRFFEPIKEEEKKINETTEQSLVTNI